LGAPLLALKGHGAAEVEQTYGQARALCQRVGETSQLVSALLELFAFYLARPELQTARELGEQLFTLAQNVQDPGLFVVAHRMLGTTLFYLGEVSSAYERLQQGLALYTAQQHLPAYFYGQDVQVYCRVYAAMALWLLGYPDQALQTIQQARTQALAHPFSQAVALDHSAWVHQYRREAPLVQEQAEAALALSCEQGFAMYVAIGTVLRGWALAKQAQQEEGIAQICQGLAACRTVGLELLQPYFLAMLAEAYGDAGQIDDGLAVLAEAVAVTENTGVRCWEAEQYRLRGELLLQAGVDTRQAETCFRQALDVARHQQAKSLELRTAMSLARLWQQQGRQAEAHVLLAPIYNWFTEGLDTADLQEAKALLEELGE
jgi:predicted ATPase